MKLICEIFIQVFVQKLLNFRVLGKKFCESIKMVKH